MTFPAMSAVPVCQGVGQFVVFNIGNVAVVQLPRRTIRW